MRKQLYFAAIGVSIVVGCRNVAERSASVEDASGAPAQGLHLTALPVRTTAGISGPLEVEITLRNLTDSVVQFRPVFNFGAWLDAEIVDASGSVLPRVSHIDPPNAWAVSLRTGDSVTDTVDLRCSLEMPDEHSCIAPYDLSRPGAYAVRMHFTLPCDIEGCGNLVKVEAKPFTVRVRR
jgi:hypothetical protein